MRQASVRQSMSQTDTAENCWGRCRRRRRRPPEMVWCTEVSSKHTSDLLLLPLQPLKDKSIALAWQACCLICCSATCIPVLGCQHSSKKCPLQDSHARRSAAAQPGR